MRELSIEGMQAIDGGGWGSFFTGVSCGATAVGAIAAWVSPEPVSKLAAYGLTAGAIACIGGILAT